MKQPLFLFITISVIAFGSCKESTELGGIHEKVQIEIPGQGGQSIITLGAGSWKIEQVINYNGNVRIFGDAYGPSGEVIRKGQPLELEGLGTLTSLATSRGLRITHETPGSIEVSLRENSSEQPFHFAIILRNGDLIKEVAIEQPISPGYSFERIEYFLDGGDKDSIYIRNQIVTYEFNHISSKDVEIFPYAGPNVVVTSYFESDAPEESLWLVRDSVEMPVPADIINGNIHLAAQKRIYGEIWKEPYQSDQTVTIPTPSGHSKFAVDIEERRRTVSYRIIMKSNATEESKVVTGKWVEVSPTGLYEINRID